MVIPDVGEDFLVSGTATVNNIYTTSQNTWLGKVRYIAMTAAGSGYNPASPPSVSFSGGGGTGAAGTALVANNGTIIGVQITNAGSGYTSAPTVTFGSGAATAVARVGCINQNGRVIRLMLQGASTIKNGTGNLGLSGGDFVGSTGAEIVTLRGSYGNWYLVSRSTAT
jgi:hypothetical protein